jgi:hypothetical protein
LEGDRFRDRAGRGHHHRAQRLCGRKPIAAERTFIHALLRDGKISDESRRRIERDLDLKEASLSNREHRKIPL